MADDEIDILHVDEPVAVDTGHVGVDLGDDHGCLVRGGFDHIHADAETQIPVLVGKAESGQAPRRSVPNRFLIRAGTLERETGV